MKRFLEFNVVALLGAIMASLLFPIHNIGAFLGISSGNATYPYDLVDDFSWINHFSNVSQNPWKDEAILPYWNTSWTNDSGEIAYHTNYLGYFASSGKTSNPDEGGLAVVEPGGYRSFTWNNSEDWWWWYSLLGIPENSIYRNLTAFGDGYLSLRVKGKNGGEKFYVKLEDDNSYYQPPITNYATITTNWQTVKIPLWAYEYYGVDLSKVKAVTLAFSRYDAYYSPKTIYFDDIAFVPENDPVAPPDGFVKPQSQGPVQIDTSTRSLLVDNQPYRIQGVCYQPTPIGQSPEGLYDNQGYLIPFEPYTLDTCMRDFPNLTSVMSANTVRSWVPVGNFTNTTGDSTLLYAADFFNVSVCAGYWIPQTISFFNEWAKDHVRVDFKNYVNAFKNAASLLLWVIGNENNLFNGYDWHYYNFTNELAKIAYQQEGATYHPVAIVESPYVGSLGNPALGSDDSHLNYVDVVGLNAYIGKTFLSVFDTYAAATQKPLWISEYGNDAWHTLNIYNASIGYEDQANQTDYNVNNWIDIVRHGDVCIGGTAMAYSDEWWKDPALLFSPGNLSVHNYGGYISGALPDMYANEEWWGLVNVTKSSDPSKPDIISPRDIYYKLYNTKIGGKANLAKYKKAKKVVLKGPQPSSQSSTCYLDGEGLYHFTQLQPGIYTALLFSDPLAGDGGLSLAYPIIFKRVKIEEGQTKVVDFK